MISKVKLNEILSRNKEQIEILDSKRYTQVTVRLWGKGVCQRDEVLGDEIKSNKRYIIKKNQFILSKIDARHGAYGLVPSELNGAVTTADFLTYNLNKDKILPEYFYWIFAQKKFIQLCKHASSGTTNRIRLKEDKFLDIEINIHDILEQQDIVDALNENNTVVDDLKNYNVHNNYLLEKLRQSILQEAVQGKLVPQDPNDVPASILLEKIKKDKEKLIKEKKIKKEKPLPVISEEEIHYDLPNGWEWVRLSEIFRFIDYRGKTPPKIDDGIRLITAKNVRPGYICKVPEEFISEPVYNTWMTRGFPKKGDLLITTEAPLGNIAILDTIEKVAFAQRVIILQKHTHLISEYLMYILMSPTIQNSIHEKKTGMTAKGIKSSRLKLILIPLPPLNEQKRIVKKVDQLIKLCDELGKKVKENQKNSELLMEAVLREAFEVN